MNKKVPKELVNAMNEILFVNEKNDISDISSRLAFDFVLKQEKKYQRVLLLGLALEIRSYKKRVAKEKKQKKLLGD